MSYNNTHLADLLTFVDLGSPVAESDPLLELSRVETSTFTSILNDRVDLIPGTKGSGKSALFRIFVDFLPGHLLNDKKIVIAHGVERQGDSVFLAFNEQFKRLSEDEFIDFWYIYLISLSHEQFLKSKKYQDLLKFCDKDIQNFKSVCHKAKIPAIEKSKSLRDILEWTLNILKIIRPKLTYKFPENVGGQIDLDLFGKEIRPVKSNSGTISLPTYVGDIKKSLEAILRKIDHSLWLMIDKLDEIFPRGSTLETKALRGLLKSLKTFGGDRIRIKIFLRDDMLDNLVSGKQGFTALTHITARQSDTLKWSEDQMLTLIIKRIFSNKNIRDFFSADRDRIEASLDYRKELFYKIFPPSIHKGRNQSSTIRWICSRVSDGNSVATPRDVIDLLSFAKDKQYDDFRANSGGTSNYLLNSSAIIYGFKEMAKMKKTKYLKAEFPKLWSDIEKFENKKATYTEESIRILLKEGWKEKLDQFKTIGLISRKNKNGSYHYSFPYVYREALNLSQGYAR